MFTLFRKSRRSRDVRTPFSIELLESRRLLTQAPGLSAVVATLAPKSASAVSAEATTPTVSISDSVYNEGKAGQRTVATTIVTLSSAATQNVVIRYKTYGDTATGLTKLRDYVPATGTITIPKGSTVGKIKTVIVGDDRSEPDEDYIVSLTSAKNATLPTDNLGNTPYARMVIRDDDTSGLVRPTLTVTGSTAVEGSPAVYVLTLSSATDRDVSFKYSTVAGTADAARYTAVTGMLTIPAGQTSALLLVPTAEGSQPLLVLFSGVSNALPEAILGTATITDVGTTTPTEPGLTVAGGSATVGTTGTSTLTFTVSLSAASTSTVTVAYGTVDNSAVAGTDYVAASGTLTFNPGVTSQTVTVTVNPGAASTTAKTFNLVLSNAQNALLTGSSAVGTINYGTAVTTPAITASPASVQVGPSGTATLTFTVSLSDVTTNTVTAQYATKDVTALAGTDYTAASGTLTFAPGTLTQTVTVTVKGEATTNSTKTLSLVLSSPSNGTVATGSDSATGTISYVTAGTSVDLSDNLANTTGGTEEATGTTFVATSFQTDSSTYSLDSVARLLAQATAGTATVAIDSDGGLQPGSLVATLTTPASIGTTAAETTFTAPSTIALSANTTYWIVLSASGGGAYNWSWTSDDTGTGAGFSKTWAESTDSGTSWFAHVSSPTQVRVNATVTG